MLAVPALVFGMYGTNFSQLPWILGERWGYPIVLGVPIVVDAVLWRRFKRWLGVGRSTTREPTPTASSPGVVAGKRLEMNRLPASQRYRRRSQRWKRYEKQLSGHQLQVDVKFIEPLGQKGLRRKKFYQFTAIDDCTRLRVLRGYPRCDQRPPSPSSTTPCQSCRSRSSACQKTTVPSSAPRSTGTCSTKASTTSRSNIGRRGSTARCVKTWLGAAPGRSDPGQGVTMVSFVRFVGRLWCSVTARTGQTDLT